jgi:predicted YcjX-like family ATPase
MYRLLQWNMKYKLIYLFLLSLYFPEVFAQATLPGINQRIIQYVKGVIGKQVNSGECWDLADVALTKSGAKFDKSSEKTLYIFGEEYDPRKEDIFPGDIIQFEKIVVKYQEGNRIMTESFTHHTAIVYEVLTHREIRLAHQNTSRTGKKVGISTLNLENIQKGKMFFYRPIAQN